jgi:hypothetical protein
VGKRSATVLAAATAALVAPAAAGAHLRSGTVAVDERATVSSPAASTAFSVGVYESDLALHLATRGDHTVVVLGYVGEPFLRVGPDGVSVDAAAPTAAATGLVARRAAGWRRLSKSHSVVWHDSRVTARAWRIPILVDGRRSRISGRTQRLPAPRFWPWLVLLLALLAATAALVRRGARAMTAGLLGAVAAAAALFLAAGFALDSYASPGTWIASVDEAVFLAAAAAGAAWAPPRYRPAGVAALGLVAAAVALSKGAIFLHPIALALLPGTLCRALAVVALAAGGAAAALGTQRLLTAAAFLDRA